MSRAGRRRGAPAGRPAPRLYLVTPPIEDARAFAAKLLCALEAADIAAVLLRSAAIDEPRWRAAVAALAPCVQARGIALLLDGRPELVAQLDADGAHLTGIDALRGGLGALKPERIAGAGGLKSRHDAMIAGESGVDYVMFGEPDSDGRRPSLAAVLERIAWWAELFELPCVGYAASFEEAGRIAAAGADFVAVGDDLVWSGEIAVAVRGAVAAINPMEAPE